MSSDFQNEKISIADHQVPGESCCHEPLRRSSVSLERRDSDEKNNVGIKVDQEQEKTEDESAQAPFLRNIWTS